MKTVRAKFKCESITHRENWDKEKGDLVDIELTAVTGKEGEDEHFFPATPSGSITLQTVNESAASVFKPGQTYYVDFIRADS